MIELRTTKPVEVVDITSKVEEELKKSEVKEGICLVYTLHTTTALVVNENEPGLIQDILKTMESLAPKGQDYRHWGDNNAHAHIQASILGNSAVLPVEGGSLVTGTWQRILFFELDGPRNRRVYVRTTSG